MYNDFLHFFNIHLQLAAIYHHYSTETGLYKVINETVVSFQASFLNPHMWITAIT